MVSSTILLLSTDRFNLHWMTCPTTPSICPKKCRSRSRLCIPSLREQQPEQIHRTRSSQRIYPLLLPTRAVTLWF
uniref:Uncharacterized protein n=1 Tax=Arundo donax TaxID=35708 RepID=A0A0A9EJ92_ARUDO